MVNPLSEDRDLWPVDAAGNPTNRDDNGVPLHPTYRQIWLDQVALLQGMVAAGIDPADYSVISTADPTALTPVAPEHPCGSPGCAWCHTADEGRPLASRGRVAARVSPGATEGPRSRQTVNRC